MILLFTMQAMLGYGDDEYVSFRDTSLEAFKCFLTLSSLDDITKTRQSKAKYNYPYIEEDAAVMDDLSDGGVVMMQEDNFMHYRKVAWVTDKFGVTWQPVLEGLQ